MFTSVAYTRNSNQAWEILAIDRQPYGALGSLCVEVSTERTNSCAYVSSQYHVLAIKAPEAVASQYNTEAEQTYITPINLPAFLTYIEEFQYQDVDMTHVDPTTGIWILYTGTLTRATVTRAAHPTIQQHTNGLRPQLRRAVLKPPTQLRRVGSKPKPPQPVTQTASVSKYAPKVIQARLSRAMAVQLKPKPKPKPKAKPQKK